MIKNFLNPDGHQNRISGSKVTGILLKEWILPIDGVASGRVYACSLRSRLVFLWDGPPFDRHLCITIYDCSQTNTIYYSGCGGVGVDVAGVGGGGGLGVIRVGGWRIILVV